MSAEVVAMERSSVILPPATEVVASSAMMSHTPTMNPQSTQPGHTSQLSSGVVAAIVVGLIALISICVCVMILIFLRKRKYQLKPDAKNESSFSLGKHFHSQGIR